MSKVVVYQQGESVTIMRSNPLTAMGLTFPEANKLQSDIRKLLCELGCTLMDAV